MIGKILKSNILILFSIFLGGYIGTKFPQFGNSLKPLSTIYLSLISIAVVPIVFTSLMSSICKTFAGDISPFLTKRMFLSFFVSALCIASIAILVGFITGPGTVIANNPIIADIIYEDMQKNIVEISLSDPLSKIGGFDPLSFMISLFPNDFFGPFADGKYLQIVFLSLGLGSALSFLPAAQRDPMLESLSHINKLFQIFMKSFIYLLPFGVFCLIASSLSALNMDTLSSILRFYFSLLLCFLIMVLCSLVVLKIYSPETLKSTLLKIRESLAVSFSTCSNQIAQPFLISALSEDLKLKKKEIETIIPLTTTLFRGGSIAYFALTVIFITDAYAAPLSLENYALILLGSVLVSLIGVGGIVGISSIALILSPLGIPLGAMLVILIIIDPIIDPFRTTTSTFLHTAIATLISNHQKIKTNL